MPAFFFPTVQAVKAAPEVRDDVSATDGIVARSGSVDNVRGKTWAFEVAVGIRDVRGVISRPDADIREEILAAMFQDSAAESYKMALSKIHRQAAL